jgi:putative tryptophan/tyrosine transport system substrate-binding protein
MIRRREFITLLGGAAALPVAARAQQPDQVRRIGALITLARSHPEAQAWASAFDGALRALGWADGRNARIDWRWADGEFDKMQAIAKDLVAGEAEVILAGGGAPGLRALLQETRTIPIVFTVVSDPVGLGFVESLARPGGNVTGFTTYEPSVGAKWVELLKQIAPQIRRIALVFNPQGSSTALYLPFIEAAAASFAIELVKVPIRDPDELGGAIAALGREPGRGLIFPPDTFLSDHSALVAALAARHRLPAVYPFRHFVADDGGLISYGADNADMHRRAAAYVDRILKGANAADLPVQQPTKFELVINLKTAKGLSLTVPPNLLAIADEVIE